MNSVVFAPDGATLASGSCDCTIKLGRVADGTLIRTLTGHEGWVHDVAFSPDGQLLASASFDRTIKLWGVPDGALLRTHSQETGTAVTRITFTPDKSAFAYARVDGTVAAARNLWHTGDLNCDGVIDFGGINPFVALPTGGR